jgi:hypothetical protein
VEHAGLMEAVLERLKVPCLQYPLEFSISLKSGKT